MCNNLSREGFSCSPRWPELLVSSISTKYRSKCGGGGARTLIIATDREESLVLQTSTPVNFALFLCLDTPKRSKEAPRRRI